MHQPIESSCHAQDLNSHQRTAASNTELYNLRGGLVAATILMDKKWRNNVVSINSDSRGPLKWLMSVSTECSGCVVSSIGVTPYPVWCIRLPGSTFIVGMLFTGSQSVLSLRTTPLQRFG